MKLSHFLFGLAVVFMVVPIQMLIFQQERFEQWIDIYLVDVFLDTSTNDLITIQSIWNQNDSQHILLLLIISFCFTVLTAVTDYLEKKGKI